jgi:hypothetical protein
MQKIKINLKKIILIYFKVFLSSMMHHNTRHDTRGNTSIIFHKPNPYTKGAFEIIVTVVV